MLPVVLTIFPLWFVGFILTRVLSSEKRVEVILPTSLFGGITIFIFTLNIVSYVVHPPLGIYISYALFILFGLLVVFRNRTNIKAIDIPDIKICILLLLSLIIWAVFLFNVIGHFSLSGDPSLYEIIGRTFARGNFPILQSWQPEITLSYHYGPSLFLGFIFLFTHASFDFIQRFTSFIIVLLLSQFLIWILKRHITWQSFTIYQLFPLMSLVALANYMIVIPILPLHLPAHVSDFFTWISQLPTINQAIVTYGGAIVSLGPLVYWYHELIGWMCFIWIVWLSFTYNKQQRFFSWVIIAISIASLSLINEIFLLPAFFISGVCILVKEYLSMRAISIRSILFLSAIFIICSVLIIFEGGIITQTIIAKKSEYPSTYFFPNKNKFFVLNSDKRVVRLSDFETEQQSSFLFPLNKQWFPFRWFHPGFIIFYIINIAICLILFLKKQNKKLFLACSFLCFAVLTSLSYNFVYTIFNGSRFIALAYTFLGINITLAIVWVLSYAAEKRKILLLFYSIIFALYFIIPSLLPLLFQLFIYQEKENKLVVQEATTLSPTLQWIAKNLPYNIRLVNIMSDVAYNNYTLANVGIFTPLFNPKYRAYTREGSPEYVDMIYTLNPSDVSLFKIQYMLIDSASFAKLPVIRQKQILDSKFFVPVYNNSLSQNSWERVYKITPAYSKTASDLPGTFSQLRQIIIPQNAKIYIDKQYPEGIINESDWDFFRRNTLFALKDRDLYYEKALRSGNFPYVHVEAYIRGTTPTKNTKFDYLILSNVTKPESICHCETQLLWKSFEDRIIVWKVIK